MKNLENKNTGERGNVLFYILIAVSLLASLVYAVSQSGRGSVQHVNMERTKLLASEITDFANTVATAYAQIRLRGCKIDQISFQNPLIAAYDNPGAPTDQTCDIFELAGGGVTLKNPPAEAGVNGGGVPVQLFTIETEIEEIGSTCGDANCTELLLVSGPVKKDVCMQINDSIGIDNPSASPPKDNAAFASMAKYTGAPSYKTVVGDGVTSAVVKGKNAACIEDTDDSNFYFYKVLATR